MPFILLHLLNSFLTKELQIQDIELFCYKAQKGKKISVFGCYIRHPFYKSRWCPNDLTLESISPFLLLSQKINQQIHRPPGQTQSVYHIKTGGCLKESSVLWSNRWVPWCKLMPLPPTRATARWGFKHRDPRNKGHSTTQLMRQNMHYPNHDI